MLGNKKILWKSDLWEFCLVGALIGLLFIADACLQWIRTQPGESFGCAGIGVLFLGMAAFGALIDRSEAIRREALFSNACEGSEPPDATRYPDTD